MVKAFTVASWNVEHFKNNPDRTGLVIKFLEEQNPHVFALYKVESADVYDILVTKRVKMRRISKNKPHTWWNGPGKLQPSNLFFR